MKKITLFISLLFIYVTSVNAQQTSKTLVKTFDVADTEMLVTDLNGEIIAQTWDKDGFAQVQITVTYENASKNIMTFLIAKGRYNLHLANKKNNALSVTQPNYKKDISINKKGNILIEQVVYTFYLPKSVRLINANELSVSQLGESPR